MSLLTSSNITKVAIGLALLAAPIAAFAQNLNCTLIVPPNPLSAQGLATPYQMIATNPANGPCNEANANQSAFVQGVFINPANGQISIYNPLVIDAGTAPAVVPTAPALPAGAVVALFFGSNGNNLTLQFHGADEFFSGCIQGFGQEAWCNAIAFFAVANENIALGRLVVPPLGTGVDGLPCPTVRSFRVVDQDQSDNVTTTYLKTATGQFAQNTAANFALFPTATVVGNPSDNRLDDVFLLPSLGCKPMTAPDVANAGAPAPALPLNELLAAAHQAAPLALVPLGDPFTFAPPLTGTPNLFRVDVYRLDVDQPLAFDNNQASTTTYCQNLRTIHTAITLIQDKPFFVVFKSPMPDVANSLWTFMAQRYVASYQILGCAALLGKPVNVQLILTGGIVTDAIVTP